MRMTFLNVDSREDERRGIYVYPASIPAVFSRYRDADWLSIVPGARKTNRARRNLDTSADAVTICPGIFNSRPEFYAPARNWRSVVDADPSIKILSEIRGRDRRGRRGWGGGSDRTGIAVDGTPETASELTWRGASGEIFSRVE